jgi:hypothetical protein
MARLIQIDDMQTGYKQILSTILLRGEPRSARGRKTLDLHDVIIELSRPEYATPTGVGRKLSLPLASAETTHLIAGLSDAEQLIKITDGRFQAFTVGHRQPGAYGPRIYDQMPQVVRLLAEDPDTRQAGVNLWRPDELSYENPDIPCTLSCWFSIDDGRLNMSVTMRSNDAWLGVPYDFTMMTRLQMTLAWALGVGLGTYTHHAVSLHLYEEDLDRAADITSATPAKSPVAPFTSVKTNTRPGIRATETALNRWFRARKWARNAMTTGRNEQGHSSENVAWHEVVLGPYLTGGMICNTCKCVLPRLPDLFYPYQLENERLGTCRHCVDAKWARQPKTSEQRLEARCASYGVTVEWFQERLVAQDGNCEICGCPPNNGRYRELVIDHDHETGIARGLICNRCNHALGLAHDSPARLIAMAEYLRRAADATALG